MIQSPNIRPVKPHDLPAIKKVIDSSELFPSEMLDDMIAPFFSGENEGDFWITYDDNSPTAVAYFAPEQMTNGTYNLYLIAVHRDHKGKKIGQSMLRHVEAFLKQSGVRILLVETSGLPSFERTREFYRKNGYVQEARIREFYDVGDDKVVFWKSLKD